ncbi:MAG: Crp/Fnr family transcriptional regulator [Deltaproteobacteria bacterium]|nr:Crp/Fnr family transcriptional regulator [Deltaproteobacteria bacterium]
MNHQDGESPRMLLLTPSGMLFNKILILIKFLLWQCVLDTQGAMGLSAVLYMDIKKFLSTTFLFQQLTPSELGVLASICNTKRLKKNQILFSEGDEALAFFAVVYGQIKVFKLSKNGDEQTLHIQAQGDLVAEAVLFGLNTYPAHARALMEALVVSIPKKSLVDLILKDPGLSFKLMAGYSKRLKEFVATIESLALTDPKERLVWYIKRHGQRDKKTITLNLSTSKKELSNMLGITPETLSRTLKVLKRDHILDEKKGVLMLKDLRGF